MVVSTGFPCIVQLGQRRAQGVSAWGKATDQIYCTWCGGGQNSSNLRAPVPSLASHLKISRCMPAVEEIECSTKVKPFLDEICCLCFRIILLHCSLISKLELLVYHGHL